MLLPNPFLSFFLSSSISCVSVCSGWGLKILKGPLWDLFLKGFRKIGPMGPCFSRYAYTVHVETRKIIWLEAAYKTFCLSSALKALVILLRQKWNIVFWSISPMLVSQELLSHTFCTTALATTMLESSSTENNYVCYFSPPENKCNQLFNKLFSSCSCTLQMMFTSNYDRLIKGSF